MLTRRQFSSAAATTVLLPVFGYEDAARAGGLNLGGIGASLLQGLGGFATQPIQSLVQTGMSLAASALNLPEPVASMAAPLIGAATSLFQPGAAAQAAPALRKSGVQDRNLSMFSRASNRPLQRGPSFSDSDEQFLRADPYGYISNNAEFLGDFVNSGAGDIIPWRYLAPGASRNGAGDLMPSWGVAPIAYQGQSQTSGFHPSVSAPSAPAKKNDFGSILHDVAALAPLISMFFL